MQWKVLAAAAAAAVVLAGCGGGGDSGAPGVPASPTAQRTTATPADEGMDQTNQAVVSACVDQAKSTQTYLTTLVGQEFTKSALEQLNASMAAAREACSEADFAVGGEDPEARAALQSYQDKNSALIVDLAAVFEQGGDVAAAVEANSEALTEATSALVAAMGG